MTAGGTLLVILALTSVNAMLAKANSKNHVFICEDATRNLTRCVNYPAGIIDITDVEFPEFPEENEYVCGNNQVNVNSTSKCSASEDDARKLTSILGKICNGKRFCKVHLAHGIYKGMHLPCRDLNMRIRIGVLYECIYSPKTPGTIDKATHSTAKLSTIGSSNVSLSTLPSSILTSTTVGASRVVITGATAVEPTATEAPNSKGVWKRRRPKSCNLSPYEDSDENLNVISSAPRVIFSFSCLVAQVLYLFIYFFLDAHACCMPWRRTTT